MRKFLPSLRIIPIPIHINITLPLPHDTIHILMNISNVRSIFYLQLLFLFSREATSDHYISRSHNTLRGS